MSKSAHHNNPFRHAAEMAKSFEHPFAPVVGYMFFEPRGWQFDLAWPDLKLAVVIPGNAGDRDKAAIEDEAQKICEAKVAGWRVLYATRAMVRTGLAVKYARQLIEKIRAGAPPGSQPVGGP